MSPQHTSLHRRSARGLLARTAPEDSRPDRRGRRRWCREATILQVKTAGRWPPSLTPPPRIPREPGHEVSIGEKGRREGRADRSSSRSPARTRGRRPQALGRGAHERSRQETGQAVERPLGDLARSGWQGSREGHWVFRNIVVSLDQGKETRSIQRSDPAYQHRAEPGRDLHPWEIT